MTKEGCLTLVPSGGLGNRMRAIASALCLCRATGSRLRVVWFKDMTLNARYSDIFLPPDPAVMEMRDAAGADFIVNDRPRRHNLWVSKLPQLVAFDKRIDEWEVTPLKGRGFDFEAWLRGSRCWMSCYQEFGTCPDSLYARLFRPSAAVESETQRFVGRFSPYTVGIHIRRTDHSESISKSPTKLFVDAARAEEERHAGMTIFLATDSDEVKAEFKAAFGNKVITSEKKAERSSRQGIIDGLADMMALAATCKIYRTAGSTFSEMAARIGNRELITLSN